MNRRPNDNRSMKVLSGAAWIILALLMWGISALLKNSSTTKVVEAVPTRQPPEEPIPPTPEAHVETDEERFLRIFEPKGGWAHHERVQKAWTMILAFSLWVKVCFWAALFVGLKSGVIETSEISTITVLGFAAVWALVAGFVGIIAPIKANMNRSWVAYVIIMVLIALVAGLLH